MAQKIIKNEKIRRNLKRLMKFSEKIVFGVRENVRDEEERKCCEI